LVGVIRLLKTVLCSSWCLDGVTLPLPLRRRKRAIEHRQRRLEAGVLRSEIIRGWQGHLGADVFVRETIWNCIRIVDLWHGRNMEVRIRVNSPSDSTESIRRPCSLSSAWSTGLCALGLVALGNGALAIPFWCRRALLAPHPVVQSQLLLSGSRTFGQILRSPMSGLFVDQVAGVRINQVVGLHPVRIGWRGDWKAHLSWGIYGKSRSRRLVLWYEAKHGSRHLTVDRCDWIANGWLWTGIDHISKGLFEDRVGNWNFNSMDKHDPVKESILHVAAVREVDAVHVRTVEKELCRFSNAHPIRDGYRIRRVHLRGERKLSFRR